MILPIRPDDNQRQHDPAMAWRRQLLLDIGTPAGAAPTPAATASGAGGGGATAASAITPSMGTTAPKASTPNVKPMNAPPGEIPVVASESPAAADASEAPGTIYITTRRPSSSTVPKSTSTGKAAAGQDDGNILSRAVANSNLSWWQLICVAIAGLLCIGVGVWAVFRQRRKKREDEERRKEVEALEKEEKAELGASTAGKATEGDVDKAATGMGKGRKGGGGESAEDSEWDSEDDYDSFSDGGTIRPRRRPRRRERGRWKRRRGRDRERDYYSSDESDFSYHGESRARSSRRNRDRDRDRRPRSPSPSPSPTPRARDATGKRKSFRDSVFSTYQSMKSAAVRLKQAEMTEKLKKQLEDEERIEAIRQAKVKEANREIEKEVAWLALEKERELERLKRELEEERRGKGRMGSGDSQQLLIPPSNRPPSSTSSSSRHTPARQSSYPLPTPRRQGSASSQGGLQIPPPARVRMPARGKTVDAVWPPPSSSTYGAHEGKGELGTEIHGLLGTKPKPVRHATGIGGLLGGTGGSKGADGSGGAQPQSVPVKATKDRPTIPKGGLAPAPPGKKKTASPVVTKASGGGITHGWGMVVPAVVSKDLGIDHGWPTARPPIGGNAGSLRGTGGRVDSVASGSMGSGGGGGNKWTDRMRARK
ncbi:uncharacterized protein MKK02DRAFT_28640 [Dioszegia hungarica]|uniref:Uncharacterized protein n=1 Tax=Dioszegia hungarica TaxID=4972 RepID=A0AA38H490_9TREE|nr:uncharacterized protein MKK02DRAFT_28640 [Dioszegia hungarica]KAI9633891.1 hypothetical protein MKK02DRAFT_28640 [Dioszegia hungarica]